MNSMNAPLFVQYLSAAAKPPVRATGAAAGYDLSSCEHIVVPAHGRTLVSTGIAVSVPPGTYGRVAPRSGLAVRNGLDVGAGVIDEDYRGELKVLLFNHSDDDFTVRVGDRIAQLVLERIYTPDVVVVTGLPQTSRGSGAFGSTGRGALELGALE